MAREFSFYVQIKSVPALSRARSSMSEHEIQKAVTVNVWQKRARHRNNLNRGRSSR